MKKRELEDGTVAYYYSRMDERGFRRIKILLGGDDSIHCFVYSGDEEPIDDNVLGHIIKKARERVDAK